MIPAVLLRALTISVLERRGLVDQKFLLVFAAISGSQKG